MIEGLTTAEVNERAAAVNAHVLTSRFHDYLVAGRLDEVNPARTGTKAAAHYARALRYAADLPPEECAELLERRSDALYFSDDQVVAIEELERAIEYHRLAGADDRAAAARGRLVSHFACRGLVREAEQAATESIAVLNGRFIDGVDTANNPELSIDDFGAVFLHEFGHFFNLDHSQINLIEAFDNNPSNDDAIATMFPILINGAEANSLAPDDVASVSMLYPAPSFASTTGTIRGRIARPDGVVLHAELRLGYGGLGEPAIREGIRRLAEAVDAVST